MFNTKSIADVLTHVRNVAVTAAATVTENLDVDLNDDVLAERDRFCFMCRVCGTDYITSSKRKACKNCTGLFCESCVTVAKCNTQQGEPIRACKCCSKGESPGGIIRNAIRSELLNKSDGSGNTLHGIVSTVNQFQGSVVNNITQIQGSVVNNISQFHGNVVSNIKDTINNRNFTTATLSFKRIEAMDLKHVEMLSNDKNDPYVILRFVRKKDWTAQTAVLNEAGSHGVWDLPVTGQKWNVEMSREDLSSDFLQVLVMDHNKYTSHVLIGDGQIALARVLEKGVNNGDVTLEVGLSDKKGWSGKVVVTVALVDEHSTNSFPFYPQKTHSKSQYQGSLVSNLRDVMHNRNFTTATMTFKRVEATDLKHVVMLSNDKSDPYVILRFVRKKDWTAQTAVLHNVGSHGIWDLPIKEQKWKVEMSREDLSSDFLHVVVMDYSSYTSHVLIGDGQVALTSVLKKGVNNGDVTLEVGLSDKKGWSGKVVVTVALVDEHSTSSFPFLPPASAAQGSGKASEALSSPMEEGLSEVQPRSLTLSRGGYYCGKSSVSMGSEEIPSTGYFELTNKSDEACGVKVVTASISDSRTAPNTLLREAVYPRYLIVPPDESVYVILDRAVTSVDVMLLFNIPKSRISSGGRGNWDTDDGGKKRSATSAAVGSFKQVAINHIDCDGKNVLLKYKGDGALLPRSGNHMSSVVKSVMKSSVSRSRNHFNNNVENVQEFYRSTGKEVDEYADERPLPLPPPTPPSLLTGPPVNAYESLSDGTRCSTAGSESGSAGNNSSSSTSVGISSRRKTFIEDDASAPMNPILQQFPGKDPESHVSEPEGLEGSGPVTGESGDGPGASGEPVAPVTKCCRCLWR